MDTLWRITGRRMGVGDPNPSGDTTEEPVPPESPEGSAMGTIGGTAPVATTSRADTRKRVRTRIP